MLKKCKKLCKDNDVTLLYLSKFGSHLYGTDTPKSDVDYKGVFLPSKKQCLLGKQSRHITYSSGKNNSKNSKDDVDIQLWSLHYFLKLVSEGETNALDLLYSHTYPEMIVYQENFFNVMDFIFEHHQKLFNIKNCKAFVGYAIGQAKKYGIKGSRLGVLKKVYEFILKINEGDDKIFNNENLKLSYIIDDIDNKFHDNSFCFIKEFGKDKKTRGLVLCGKVHLETISLIEFFNRIKNHYKSYGDRAKKAEQNEGIDWKALSHAVRALIQMKELIHTGKIQFPLKNIDIVKRIKAGDSTFKEVETLIYDDIELIDRLLNDPDTPIYNKRKQFVLDFAILMAYDEQGVG